MAYDVNVSQFLTPLKQQMKLNAQERTNRIEYENKQNNQMIDMLWKAATDDGTPKALFENIQGMAKELTRTMSPQQRTSLSAVVARGLFSKQDRMSNEYQRIKGPRPGLNFETITMENFQQYAEGRVAQVEWDYGHKAYLAGGKEKLGAEATPELIPAGSFMDKEDKRHDIYAFKNSSTGQVHTLDTQTDIPGDMLAEAKKQGFGPTMIAKWNFIPFKGETSRLITLGDTQYMMHTGVKLSTGEPHSIKIPVGPATEASQRKPIQPPGQALDTINWIENVTNGGVDIEKAGKYQGWVAQAKALQKIPVPKEQYLGDMPDLGSDYGSAMIAFQRKFQRSHTGWAIAPITIGHKEAGGMWPTESLVTNYYAENAGWALFPSDGERPLLIDGKRTTFHYKERLGKEYHVWHDYYGKRLYEYTGVLPGTEVNE